MKLIDTYIDKYHRCQTQLFEYPNGVRVAMTINPHSVDFDLAVVLRAGSFYETQLGVPDGTAHFLEHMIAGNPNKRFKNRGELLSFTFGDKSYAGFVENASTSSRFMKFYTHGHQNAAKRMVEYVRAWMDYPIEDMSKYIEKERKVIHGEISRRKKLEHDSYLQYAKFFFDDTYPEFAKDVLGTVESLDKITIDHLHKFFDAAFCPDNLLIAIQLSKKPNAELQGAIDGLVSTFTKKQTKLTKRPEEIKAEFKHGYFQDPQQQGMFFSVGRFYQIPKTIDHRRSVLLNFMDGLLWRAGHEYLREEKHLVYDLEIYNQRFLFTHGNRGFSTSCTIENFPLVLDESYYVFNEYWKTFLMSAQGENWFKNKLSQFIFDRNREFDENYAEDIAVDILAGEDYHYYYMPEAVKVAKKLTREDLASFIDNFMQAKPSFWFNSPLPIAGIQEIFKQSKFYKAYSS